MNPGTLNRARMLEHRIQHLTEIPKHMLDHWFQQCIQRYLFQQQCSQYKYPTISPLAIFWLKQINAKYKRIEGYKRHPFLQEYEHIPMKKHLAHTT
jgi:hypothetical protein